MTTRVLIAHARGEETRAEDLAGPLQQAGFEVVYEKTVLVGDSVTERTSRVLAEGGPVVLCGTTSAIGSRWARMVVNAARRGTACKVFCVRMEEDADVELLAFDERIAEYWQDPTGAAAELIAALRRSYPADEEGKRRSDEEAAEARYRRLALESCDIIDLANLPETDRHIATRELELRRLYVPLHVTVEASVEGDGDDERLRLLEDRRAAERSWSAHAAVAERGVRAPLGERLVQSRRLVVLGDPGAGKTTMLRWLATAYLLRLNCDPDWSQIPAVNTLPDEEWLPVIVRCRDLDQACTSGALDDVLAHTLRKAELSEIQAAGLRTLLRMRLESGEALLLIDGLDEIVDPTLRARFAQQIERIQMAFPLAPIVATSRIVGYREMGYRIGRGFEHVTVADLSDEEKDLFAQRWCELTELPERRESATRELIQDIHSSDRIERLTSNPMLLTTMALVKRKVGRLPSRRADLYWEALQVLLNWRQEVDAAIAKREALPQLEYLAFEMCDRGVQQLREDEIIELLDRMREEYDRMYDVRRRSASEFLRLLERRTGILVEAGQVRYQGRPAAVFEFRHLTFQEYLAGLALVDGVYPGRVGSEPLAEVVGRISGHIHEVANDLGNPELTVAENWREAIRLCVANVKYDEVDDVLRAVMTPSPDEDSSLTRKPRAVLAGLCLADEPAVSVTTAEEIMNSLAAAIEGLGIDLFGTAIIASEALSNSRLRDEWEKHLIREYLKRDSLNRQSVGQVLGGVSAQSLYIRAEGDSNRAAALIACEELLVNDDAAITAFFAADYLIFSFEASKASLEGLIRTAIRMVDRNSAVAQAAVYFLEGVTLRWPRTKIPQDKLIACLRRVWQDEGVRVNSIRLFGSIQAKNAASLIRAELESPIPILRQVAALSLCRLVDKDAVKPLIACLREDEELTVRRAAAIALGILGDAAAVEPLIQAVETDDEQVRMAALYALSDLGAATVLIRYLRHSDAQVRQSTLQALARNCDLVDKRLLSQNFEPHSPFIDPQVPINEQRIALAHLSLDLKKSTIRKRYERLSSKFGLILDRAGKSMLKTDGATIPKHG